MDVPQGSFELLRHPTRPDDQLRAWDAADELLLSRLAGRDPGVDAEWQPVGPDGTTVVLNDAFGALGVGLAQRTPTSVVDSYCAARAVERNLVRNGLDPEAVRVVSPSAELSGPIALLVVRPTRSLVLLEHLLRLVRPQLSEDTVIVGAAMTKHLHTSTLEVFERLLGPTTTSRAHRRARVIESRFDPTLELGPWEWPRTFTLEPGPIHVATMPGVFAGEKLDHGTSLLLEHLPETDGPTRIVDLGCGNGVLGTIAALENRDASVTFVDDSAMAVAATRATVASAGLDDARVVHGNALSDWPADEAPLAPGSVDLVLNNPPFHDNNAVGDAIAWQMFSDGYDALAPGGEFWCVGNRHLAYHAKLKRRFGNCEVVASSPKFVVLRAVRR
ncbi:MAG: methyltransferase [Microthrixaceae bacterium]